MRNKAVALLSGGLDSLVSLRLSSDVALALTFDYGQKAAAREIEAAAKICAHYGIEHKVILIDFLKEITKTALVSDDAVPCENDFGENSAKAVWVPNRNALFLNIAASFADSEDFSRIIIGANKEEAQTFPDNTADFIARANALFEFSTLTKPKVVAPLLNYGKIDIMKIALEQGMPLSYVWSCYNGGQEPCGECESCVRFRNAANKVNQ